MLQQFGVQFGNKVTLAAVKQIPGKTLIQINKAVGFRLVTKAGTTGLVNITKAVPLISGFVGGTVDYAAARAVGRYAERHLAATLVHGDP